MEHRGGGDRGWPVCVRNRGMVLLRGRALPRSLQLSPPSSRHLMDQDSVNKSLPSQLCIPTPGTSRMHVVPPLPPGAHLCFLALCLNATYPSGPSSVLLPPGSPFGLPVLPFARVSESWAIGTAQLILLSSLPTQGARLASPGRQQGPRKQEPA